MAQLLGRRAYFLAGNQLSHGHLQQKKEVKALQRAIQAVLRARIGPCNRGIVNAYGQMSKGVLIRCNGVGATAGIVYTGDKMRFDLITIFPEFFSGPLEHGIVRRAREAGLIQTRVQDLREFTKDRHRTVDDRPFGGGEGMVLKPEPLFEAVESLLGHCVGDAAAQHAPDSDTAIVLMSAAGKRFDQETARRYSQLNRIILICGRYEGVDERVAEHLATEEVSIGDFVLSGGELPALLVMDAVTRLIPGALGNEASSQNESFSAPEGIAASDNLGSKKTSHESPVANHILLDFPHYTRPAEYRGWKVPEILIGGNHAEVAKWRRAAAFEKTRRNRPDLLSRE